MSGFALIVDLNQPVAVQDRAFVDFKESVAQYKQLGPASSEASGRQCAIAKFDTPSALHRGVTVDKETGSWLLAVGTVLGSEGGEGDRSGGDLHALLTRYLRSGNAALQSLDGPFALVIYDKVADRLAIITDPMGFISIFHARRGSQIYVATSALAVAKAVQATPSEFGVYLFLTTGSVYGKTTLWQEVERLPAGTVLEIAPTGTSESVYWSLSIKDEITRLSLSETVDYALGLLTGLIQRHLEREGKTWVDLTGGFDSRLITMLLDHCGQPFKACCQGPSTSPDVTISSRIAQALGWGYQHNLLPDDWGQERYEWLSRALGKVDAHLDLFKSTSVLWDQEQRALGYGTSIWGLGGELWRGTIWKQEFWNVGKTPAVDYDRLISYRVMRPVATSVFDDFSRVEWVREEVKALLKSIGDRYADYPNTVKLDCIFAYKTTGLSGSHISAVMGRQRAIAPLYFKESVAGAVSVHYKWRTHSRLVRLLMERVNPVLAGFETTDGGPALPMRITNIHRFKPYWTFIGQQLLRKGSQTVLGRSLLPAARDEFDRYPLHRWRCETLDCLEQDHVLDPAHMHSSRLYNAERLAGFVEQARTEEFGQEAFLSRILTVEMALRSVGASF